MFKIIHTIALPVILSASLTATAHNHDAASATSAPSKAAATQMALRDLWVDHVFWVRNVVMAKSQKNKQLEAESEKQVVANAKSIAAAIEPFYGKAANEKLFGLLAGHYGAIKDYMNATMPKPNDSKQKAAVEKLTNNAKEIAAFLSGANPNLPEATLVGLLAAHGGHHVAQINQLQKNDFAGEVETWVAMKGHMYTIADALTSALVKQFPDKF